MSKSKASQVFVFDVKLRTTSSVYVKAKTMKLACTKFFAAYPKAKVTSVWESHKPEMPVILK